MNACVGHGLFPVEQVAVLLIEAGKHMAFEAVLLDVIYTPDERQL